MNLLKPIDDFLNRITMYRLVVWYLVGLLLVAFVYSVFGVLPYNPLAIVYSATFLVAVSWLANTIFAHFFETPPSGESSYITGLILALIITPMLPQQNILFLLVVGVLAMASKYVLAFRQKHIFNPAAIAVVLTGLFAGQPATWWVAGTLSMMPFVVLGGFLVVRKIQRFDLVFSFLGTATVSVVFGSYVSGLGDPMTSFWSMVTHSPIFFLAAVMLTEPLTAPPRRWSRVVYGALVGALFPSWVNVGGFFLTPELALSIGNVFSYFATPNANAVLTLKRVEKLANDTHEFIFETSRRFAFKPGQYAEWTVEHDPFDNRGNRRYFTIASSPSDSLVRVGVKFYPNSSSFKHALADTPLGGKMKLGGLAGDFTLPNNPKKKIAFIAGGIGITPFRSMVAHVADMKETRDMVLLYSNKSEQEVAYRNFFDTTGKQAGLKTVYVLSNKDARPFPGAVIGMITPEMIAKEIPDYRERTFYISGPKGMVDAFTHSLREMGVPRSHIKSDFFPGYA